MALRKVVPIRAGQGSKAGQKKAVAIVGGASLLSRELQDLIKDEMLDLDVRLLAGEAARPGTVLAGALGLSDDEAVVLEPLTTESLAGAAVIFLTSNAESSANARKLAPKSRFVDLTGALEDLPGAAIRAPQAVPAEAQALQVIAHPAACALALLLPRLAAAGDLRRAIINIFEPASERGQKGLSELQKQSANLLSFQPLPKEIFDAQLAFNVLPEYGEDAPVKLCVIEARIDRNLASLLAAVKPPVPMPSLRLAQAPVFHGHSFSIWAEFAEPVAVAAIETALRHDLIDLRTEGLEPPANASAAQQNGVMAGSIRPDRNNSRAVWIWMASDNVRLAAANAIAAARSFL